MDDLQSPSNNRRLREVQAIKSWLSTCLSDHTGACSAPRSGPFPSRLIDLAPSVGPPRLVHTASLDPVPEFVALSYCWGQAGNLKTYASTLEAMEMAIPLDDRLPLTLKQTFSLVQALGQRYLWVDALCIIQEDKEDWEKESEKMGAIYADASLVIAAMASRSTHDGLFSEQEITPTEEFHLVMRACRTMPRRDWEKLIDQTLPLLCRGWGFQERLLARRIVHFTGPELVWECKAAVRCECGGIQRVGSVDGKVNNMNAAFSSCSENPATERVRPMWRECVKSFTRRALTYPSDRTAAINGIARLLRPEHKDLYIAGLWIDALPFDLLWRCDQSTPLSERKPRSPSWSWSSVDCGINWPTTSEQRWRETLGTISSETYFEHGLKGIECEYLGATGSGSESGADTDRRIRVTARILEVEVTRADEKHAEKTLYETEWEIRRLDGRSLPFYPDLSLPDKGKRMDEDVHPERKNPGIYWYVQVVEPEAGQIGWEAGLIVRRSDEDMYERVGVAAHMNCDPATFVTLGLAASEDMRQITLV